MSYFPNITKIDTNNSSTTPLNAGATFPGAATLIINASDVVVAVITDQDGTYTVEFSPDGTNWDVPLTRCYRTDQINVPHRFSKTHGYVKVTFTNTSVSNQTYFRLQTIIGDISDLNISTDSTMSLDFDSIAVRPTDYKYEVALGKRQGSIAWNIWGYNADIDIGTETIWAAGGTFTRMTAADTLSLVSSSADDTAAGIGARTVLIHGIDANYVYQTEVVTLNGTIPVVTVGTWWGFNISTVASAGTNGTNLGLITFTRTTGGSVQGAIPIGIGSTQKAIYFVQANHKLLLDWLYITMVKNVSGTQPILIVKCWVTDLTTGVKIEVFRDYINGSIENHTELKPSQPFCIGEKSMIEFTGTTDVNNTEVSLRLSGIEFRDVNA